METSINYDYMVHLTLSNYSYECDVYPEETVMDNIVSMINTSDSKTVIEFIKSVNSNAEVNYTELLKYACRVNKRGIVKYLLKNYRNEISIDDGYTEYTALMYAVSNMSYSIVKMLIEYNADIQMCTILGETAFDIVMENVMHKKCVKIVNLLINGSKRELSSAIRKGNVKIIKMLLNSVM